MNARAEDKGARREFHGTGLYWIVLSLILAIAILIGIIQNSRF